MLLLQIIIVPLFGLAIVGAVFMIGVDATLPTRHDSPDDQRHLTDGTIYPGGRITPPL